MRQQRSSVRRHTTQWERQATLSVEPSYRGVKEKDGFEEHYTSSVARIEVHGRDGWNLAAMLRSLDLTGIMKALEVIKQRSDLTQVCF